MSSGLDVLNGPFQDVEAVFHNFYPAFSPPWTEVPLASPTSTVFDSGPMTVNPFFPSLAIGFRKGFPRDSF